MVKFNEDQHPEGKDGWWEGHETVVGWWDCLWRGWVVTGGSEHLSGRSEQGLCGHREQGSYKEAYRGLGGGAVLRRQERRAVVREQCQHQPWQSCSEWGRLSGESSSLSGFPDLLCNPVAAGAELTG